MWRYPRCSTEYPARTTCKCGDDGRINDFLTSCLTVSGILVLSLSLLWLLTNLDSPWAVAVLLVLAVAVSLLVCSYGRGARRDSAKREEPVKAEPETSTEKPEDPEELRRREQEAYYEVRRKEGEAKQRKREEREERNKQRVKKVADNLLDTFADLVTRFLQVAERVVGKLDAYGDENWKSLPKEIHRCIEKIAERAGGTVSEFSSGPPRGLSIVVPQLTNRESSEHGEGTEEMR